MQYLNLVETAEYLESAEGSTSIDIGFAVIHIGRNAAGAKLVLINDWLGRTHVTEAL